MNPGDGFLGDGMDAYEPIWANGPGGQHPNTQHDNAADVGGYAQPVLQPQHNQGLLPHVQAPTQGVLLTEGIIASEQVRLSSTFLAILDILHKPRGTGATWQPISNGERVRVSAKSGKHMRLVVQANAQLVLESFQINLVEKNPEGQWIQSPPESFRIQSTRYASKSGVHAIITELKLYRLYKNLIFEVTFNESEQNRPLRLQSSELITHNTGASGAKRQEKKRPVSPPSNQATLPPAGQAQQMSVFSGAVNSNPQLSGIYSHNVIAGTGGHHSPPVGLDSPPSTSESLYFGGDSGGDNLNALPDSPNPFGVSSTSSSPLQHPQPPQSAQQMEGAPSITIKPDPMHHLRNPAPSMVPSFSTKPDAMPTYVVDKDLSVQGVVVAQSFMQHSDIRYKTNVEDLLDAIEIVKNLSGKRYEWRKGKDPAIDNNQGGKKVIGLIAQEVQKVVPGAVQEAPNGYLSVDYTQLMPVLIEAFKSHVREFKELRDFCDAHKESVDSMIVELRGLLDKYKEVSNSTTQDTESASADTSESSGGSEPTRALRPPRPDRPSHKPSRPARPSHKPAPEKPARPARRPPPRTPSEIAVASVTAPVLKEKDTFAVELNVDQLKRTNAQKVQLTINVLQRRRWIFAAIIGGALFVLACVLGISLGVTLSRTTPTTPSGTPLASVVFVPTELTNGDFENYDEVAGTAESWDGIYDLLVLSPRKRAVFNDTTAYPGLVPAPFPNGKVLMRMGNINTTDYAVQWVPFNHSEVSSIYKSLAVEVWTNSLFAHASDAAAQDAYKMTVYLHYTSNTTDSKEKQFSFNSGWTRGQIVIPINPAQQLFSFEINLFARCNGSTFWDNVKADFVPTSP